MSRLVSRRVAIALAIVVTCAASTDVITPHEASLDTIQERFEVEEASGDDAEPLNDLGAYGDCPRI